MTSVTRELVTLWQNPVAPIRVPPSPYSEHFLCMQIFWFNYYDAIFLYYGDVSLGRLIKVSVSCDVNQ
jgi:hypothetical protein